MLEMMGKLITLVRNRRYRRGLRHGIAATVEHSHFLASTDYSTVLDVGANCGQFSLAALAARPAARIIAFEPLRQPADRYERLFRGQANVELIRTALGDTAGTATAHVSRRMDSSSLLPIGELQSAIFPGTEQIGIEQVPVTRLDDVLPVRHLQRPTLLKIDVQGFELSVLRGAEASLREIDCLYIELSFLPLYDGQPMAHEVIAWLAKRAMVLSGVHHVSRDTHGRAVQCDASFTRVPATS